DSQLAAQIRSHRARAASRESQIINDFLPSAVWTKRFDVRRDSLNASLICRIHPSCCEVFNFTVQQQPERPATIRFAQVEFETVQLCETLKRRRLEVAEISMRKNVGQNVMPVLVPCASGRARIAAENDFEFGKRRIAGEIFVGEYIESSGMIHRQQIHFVEIYDFLQRLHKAEAEDRVPHFSSILEDVGIIFFMKHVSINFHVLSRPRNIALSWPDPVSNHAISKHVPHKLIFLAVPNEQRGA